MLSTLGYNPDTEVLVAQFNQGKFYRYDGVPQDVFVGVLTNTESHGRAFNELVKKPNFNARVIEPEDIVVL